MMSSSLSGNLIYLHREHAQSRCKYFVLFCSHRNNCRRYRVYICSLLVNKIHCLSLLLLCRILYLKHPLSRFYCCTIICCVLYFCVYYNLSVCLSVYPSIHPSTLPSTHTHTHTHTHTLTHAHLPLRISTSNGCVWLYLSLIWLSVMPFVMSERSHVSHAKAVIVWQLMI